ncbi:MAG TPA: hypothetical protein VF006_25895 [Longimicrobium sp.]
MKKSMLLAGTAMLLTAATPALGQTSISPGMSTEQVRERFGAPATTRTQGGWAYWYYLNGCPVRCGSDDVVFFQNDRVVAAVLRTARRRFAGPAADDAIRAAGGAAVFDKDPASDRPVNVVKERARVGGVRVDGAPAPADERPRPQAREGQPGEPSTIRITQPEPAPAERVTPPVPVNQAREGQPGEPATIIITTPPEQAEAAPAVETVVTPAAAAPAPAAGTSPPAVDGPLPATPAPAAAPAPGVRLENQPQLRARNPAENTEAADTRGETSIDRKNRRERQDRANEPTATERARRNDARNP